MQPTRDSLESFRNAALLLFVTLAVLGVTSNKLGVSLAGAIAFWGIVLALTSVVALFGFILLDR